MNQNYCFTSNNNNNNIITLTQENSAFATRMSMENIDKPYLVATSTENIKGCILLQCDNSGKK
jgi:hypothetical protein